MRYKLLAWVGDKPKLVDFECDGDITDEFPDLYSVLNSCPPIIDPKDEKIKVYNDIAYKHFGKLFGCKREDFEYRGHFEASKYEDKVKESNVTIEDILKEINKGD